MVTLSALGAPACGDDATTQFEDGDGGAAVADDAPERAANAFSDGGSPQRHAPSQTVDDAGDQARDTDAAASNPTHDDVSARGESASSKPYGETEETNDEDSEGPGKTSSNDEQGQLSGGSESASKAVAPCAAGNFDHDADPSTECRPWTECVAGEYVTAEGSASRNRVCAPCPSQTYSTGPNAVQCEAWTTCKAGSYVDETGTDTSDRSCAPCAAGEHSVDENSARCVPEAQCAAGTYDDGDGQCVECQRGTTCPGAAATPTACGADEWDGGNTASACVPHTVCAPGTHAMNVPDAATDRQCATCPAGTYADSPNADSCQPVTACAPGTFVALASDGTEDQQCVACPNGTFSDVSDAESCQPLTACTTGTFVANTGDGAGDQQCAACPSGTFSDSENAAACQPQTVCAPGTRVVHHGNATTNRACLVCESGTFSSSSNAATCQPWTQCAADEVQVSAGTVWADRQCRSAWPVQFGSAGEDANGTVAVAPDGSIVVAGHARYDLDTDAFGSGSLAFARKLAVDGSVVWTNYSPAQGGDFGVSAIDAAGDVFLATSTSLDVTGFTHQRSDIYLTKLSGTTGSELWTVRFGTTGDDEVRAVSIDATGDVVLAGSTSDTSSGVHALVAKLSGSDGAVSWSYQTDSGGADEAGAVTVDADGDVVFTGTTSGALVPNGNLGSADAFVVKLSGTTGSELWLQQVGSSAADRDAGVTIDENGDVLVVGSAKAAVNAATFEGNEDVFVVKLSGSAGAVQWTQMSGTAQNDSARAIALVEGDPLVVFSTDGDLGDLQFGKADVLLWQLDDSDGSSRWLHRFGTIASDFGMSAFFDAGVLYVAGATGGDMTGQGSAGGMDVFVGRFDGDLHAPCLAGQYADTSVPSGCSVCPEATYNAELNAPACVAWTTCNASDELEATAPTAFSDRICRTNWPIQFGTTLRDEVSLVATTNDGDVLVAHHSDYKGERDSFLSRRSSDDGTELWTVQLDASGGEMSLASGEYDADRDAVVVLGYDTQTFVAKIQASDGSLVWSSDLPSAGLYAAVDPAGDVVAVGYGYLPNSNNPDLFVWKLSGSDGSTIWAQSHGSTAMDRGYGVAIDGQGDVFVVGMTAGDFAKDNAGNSDAIVLKLSGEDGTLDWARQLGADDSDYAWRLTVDPRGNPIVTGATDGALVTGASGSMWVWKGDGSTGEDLWLQQFGASPNERIMALTTDRAGNVFLTGDAWEQWDSDGPVPVGGDAFLVTLAANDGSRLDLQLFGTTEWELGHAIGWTDDGRILVGGTTTGAFHSFTNAGSWDAFVHVFDARAVSRTTW